MLHMVSRLPAAGRSQLIFLTVFLWDAEHVRSNFVITCDVN
jgi:hypothetical protein